MSDVIIYDYWRSSASYRVRIALNLKGVAFDSVAVNLLDGDHRSEEHRRRNPQAFVPVLAIDGMMMTQSLAIIEYLDTRTPQPPLLPADQADKAEVEAAVEEAKQAVESGDADKIAAAKEKLEAASHKLASAMYGQPDAEGGAPGGADPGAAGQEAPNAEDAGPTEGDVIDAEFEEKSD